MDLILLKVSKPFPGKFNGMPVRRVTFEDIDHRKKYYYLNLDEKFDAQVAKWEPFLKEGNILRCNVRPNTTNIDLFTLPKVLRDVGDKDVSAT